MREDRKRAVVEALGLPRDVMMGDILLHFTGPYETVVENFRSLLIYTDLYIKIKAADCVVVFKGTASGNRDLYTGCPENNRTNTVSGIFMLLKKAV